MKLNVVPLVFAGLGLVMVAVAAWLLVADWSFARKAERSEGIVVALEERRGSKSRSTWAPIVEHQTVQGPVRFTSPGASSPPSYAVGDRVALLVDPADPANAQIDSFMERWFVPLIFGVLGVIFAGVGIGGAIYARPRR